MRTEVQMQELEDEHDEDTDMITSDGGSEEVELNEALEKEGVNLPVMDENWKTQGLEKIPEEELRKISDLFIARQKTELDRKNRRLGIVTGTGNHSKSISHNLTVLKKKKKRGRRTNREVLQDLRILMLNLGKIKALNSFPSYQ